MSLFCNDNLKIAYERSDEIIRNVPYDPNRMIDTDLILGHVRRTCCPIVELYIVSFTKIQSGIIPAYGCGAITRIEFDAGLKSAIIALNSDMPAQIQRFSLMQQIGRLVTLPQDAHLDPDIFHVRADINYDLLGIKGEELAGSRYFLLEQIANIFALRVLMPSEQFFRVIRRLRDIQTAAVFFGVLEEAVIARMMIGV